MTFAIISLVILVILLLIGVPVAFSFFASSIFLIITLDYDPSFLLPYGLSQISSTLLIAIPLFILAGNLIQKGGGGDAIVDFIEKLLGHGRYILGIVAVVSSGVFGAISGNSTATLTTIGTIIIPKLKDRGYPDGFSASLLASASVLGSLIPPSSLMIVYAWLSNTSVLAAFLATIIPGVILIILMSIINVIYINKYGIKTNKESSETDDKEHSFNPAEMEESRDSLLRSFIRALPILILAFIVLGGIYGGIITPTESAAISAIFATIIGVFIYRKLNFKTIMGAITNTIRFTGIIMIMFLGSILLNRMLIDENFPHYLSEALLNISEHKFIILIMINLFLIIVGMLMDDTSGVLLSTPILLPIVTQLGVDPVHYAAIVGVNMGLGVITPPAAPVLFLSARMVNARIQSLVNPTIIFIVFAWIPTLIITTYVPEVALFLPKLLLGY